VEAAQWWLIACIIYYKKYCVLFIGVVTGRARWAALRQVGDISLSSFTPFSVSKYLTRTRYSVVLEIDREREREKKLSTKVKKREETFFPWPLLILTLFPSTLQASAA
jgi:hypothetical protein